MIPKRAKKRQILTRTEVTILNELKNIQKFMEGAADAITELETNVSEIKRAMIIYNKFTELLNTKDLVKNEEVKEELQKDGRLQVIERKSADETESDVISPD